ncbi:MAG TPA: hypothetical protein VIX17_13800 [Pyrinomonadaceae bacterium]|jgi:hypothetical protein
MLLPVIQNSGINPEIHWDQTELRAVDQEYLTPEINMRAYRDQLRLTQHTVNKLREVGLTLFYAVGG